MVVEDYMINVIIWQVGQFSYQCCIEVFKYCLNLYNLNIGFRVGIYTLFKAIYITFK